MLQSYIFSIGDSFGTYPTIDKLYHKGTMRAKSHDCQFICVTQADYHLILHQGTISTLLTGAQLHLLNFREAPFAPIDFWALLFYMLFNGCHCSIKLALIDLNS